MLCVGLTVYSETVKPIGMIENIKRALGEIMQSSNFDVQNVTTIDVTGIELGIETEHEHVYKTMYDEEKHWEECIVCNKKRNEVVHSFTTTWAQGSESCSGGNKYTNTCLCGYSETAHKPCVWDGKTYNFYGFYHSRKCSIHGPTILYNYIKDNIEYSANYTKYPTGWGYDGIYPFQWCYKSNGTRITCNNLGTCIVCGKNYTANDEHSLMNTKLSNNMFNGVSNEIICIICGKKIGTIDIQITKDNQVPPQYTVITNTKLLSGCKGVEPRPFYSDIGSIFEINSVENTYCNPDATEFTNKHVVKLKSTIKEFKHVYLYYMFNIDGIDHSCTIYLNNYSNNKDIEKISSISPDFKEPIISTINNGDSSITEWSKSKRINISGTENYCNTVKVKILDNENNEVFSGETTVNNGNYSISCTPDIEAGLEGRTFKAIVTDACENSTEQEFTISKIDSIPPEATSNVEVGGDWAKEKSFTAVASDHGIGNVQIAFNDVADYELATKNETEYTREYKLIGDVYTPRKARIFYKDELNNISSQEITIDKLDNTAPTITGSRFDNNKLILEANDIKEGMGEGSGIAKYRFITSSTQYSNPVVSNADSTEVVVDEEMIIPNIANVKYVYVVAEDNVGNVSEVYEVEVPHLNLRTEVNLNAANGKGGVELDWTGYDPTNKVFKAYQKKEGTEEFESISTVDYYKEIEPIKVLNIYPENNSSFSIPVPTVKYEYLDGTIENLPKSASLKAWIEGGTITEGSKTTTFEAYGKNPITGQQIIKVTSVSNTDFNNNPEMIWNYDVAMFGTWDGNAYRGPNSNAINIIEKYIQEGYGILAGHDTIAYNNNYEFGKLRELRKYFNIEAGYEVDYRELWGYFSTKVKVEKKGSLTNFPYELPIGAKLSIPETHTNSNAALGNVWISLVDGRNWSSSREISNYYNAGGTGNPTYYLTTWNNTAMIQTGHSNGDSTADERKVLANTLFYLKQRTTATAFTDNSAQDLKAPNVPTVSAIREGSKIKLSHNAEDNGSEYKYYVEAYDTSDQSLLLSRSNERTEVVTTGTKGYYYIIDDNSENIDFDIKDATYVEGDSSLINLSNNGKYIHMKAVDVAGNVSEETTIRLEVEIPELVLTSKVNLAGANGKGIVELDWSTFELEDMYYVVYRKEKTATEWTKIVGLEDKLTAKKYTDILGNDITKPAAPVINISGNSIGNSIDISTVATDNGTNYVYYVEAYDAITGMLLKVQINNR